MSLPGDQSNAVSGIADTIAGIADQGGAAPVPGAIPSSGGAITVVLDWPRMLKKQ